MFQILNDALKAQLDTLKGSWKPFVSVIDHHTLENTWYPYLSFENIGFEAEILDNCTNLRTYTFEVYIFQEITETWGRDEAKEIIYKCMDDVIDLLDKNYTLWLESVKHTRPVGWTLEPLILTNGKCLVGRIQVNIETYNSIK